MESAAIGLIAGRFSASECKGEPVSPPPPTTALGALLAHITGGHLSADSSSGSRSFQPMNVNFGLFPPISVPRQPKAKEPRADGRRPSKSLARKTAMSARALADLDAWLQQGQSVAAE